jgi:hypothetical protein
VQPPPAEPAPAPVEPPPATEAPVETEAPPAETAPAEPTPLPAGEIPFQEAGRYVTTVFEPALAFDLPAPAEGFQFGPQGYQDTAELSLFLGEGGITINRLDRHTGVVEPENEGAIRSLGPFPEDMIAWYREHPRLEAGEVQDVTIGPFQGTAVDITMKQGQGYEVPNLCPSCVTQFVELPPIMNSLPEGFKEREIQLDVEGQPLLVQIGAPESSFEDVLSQAEAILSTMSVETTERETAEGGFGPGWLAAGTHTTGQFSPGFSLELPEGSVGLVEASDVLNIHKDARLFLAAVSLGAVRVYDPSSSGLAPVDAPDDLVAWFQQHPKLETTKPKAVTLGGHDGIVFDVTVKKGAGNGEAPWCFRACVALFEGSLGPIVQSEGDRVRSYILDVDGTQVAFAVLIPEYAFDELVPEGEAVLETLQFS